MGVYEKAASKATSAEPPPRWAIGTGQLSCLQFWSGPTARQGGDDIIPFCFLPRVLKKIMEATKGCCHLYQSYIKEF